MRAARAFLRAPLLRCSAPALTALSMRETRLRYSSSACVGVAVADGCLEAAEPRLHLGCAAAILEPLALRPVDPLFL